jgi:hypothetical protein
MDALFPLSKVRNEQLAGAVLSQCGTYRYTLDRVWNVGLPIAMFVMLNPSTADASKDDRTIGRCKKFAAREGCGGLTVVNLFALRATDPEELRTHPDPVGPHNAAYIGATLDRNPGVVIAAWGAHSFAAKRAADVAMVLDRQLGRRDLRLKCLGVTKSGQPRHPLYLKATAPLITYPRRKAAA